ncbi:hypothetical protein, partial [Enterobacter sp. 56-7]|uniref:hypothetical protein n=1 Tax=Enterobacter sp. 56-7 TaxID=1895906 RepID=UPI00257DE8A1
SGSGRGCLVFDCLPGPSVQLNNCSHLPVLELVCVSAWPANSSVTVHVHERARMSARIRFFLDRVWRARASRDVRAAPDHEHVHVQISVTGVKNSLTLQLKTRQRNCRSPPHANQKAKPNRATAIC